jgi:16S rRNA (uracil1498-N3)-methyltransferase
MSIAEPQLWSNWIAGENGPSTQRVFAHPDGQPLVNVDLTQTDPIQLGIGPEGGLTDAEVAAATDAGWHRISLGQRILRVETAAIALVSAISLRQPS